MPEIVLTTLNAKYIHAAFGLRYLLANLGPLQSSAKILEFDINQRTTDIAEAILAAEPRLVGLGVYIWNAALTSELVSTLKRIKPELLIVLGGPEVSYEWDRQSLVATADHVITGEADVKFAEVCAQLLRGERPPSKVIHSDLPELHRLELPYRFYDEQDIAHRIIYVEASRGCPFTCEFCLSSLDIPVRQFPLDRLLDELGLLLERGVNQFKFVDRTFNLNLATSRAILEFFWARFRPGLFLHFEMIPDRLPEQLRELIARFPAGALQFEVGIQTFNEEVAARIRRRQNYQKLEQNLRFLRENTGVHVHADLIAGLPGETVESFARGFDQLVRLRPQEIQVGILKRLRGTPIVRHDLEWEMVYNEHPPYEILRTKVVSFSEMQRLRRFARFWDLIANSGNFIETLPLIWRDAPSPFARFIGLTDWLYARTGRNHGIAMVRLAELLFEYLTTELGQEPAPVAETLWRDYQRGGRSDKPIFLRRFLGEVSVAPTDAKPKPKPKSGLKRQARHHQTAITPSIDS